DIDEKEIPEINHHLGVLRRLIASNESEPYQCVSIAGLLRRLRANNVEVSAVRCNTFRVVHAYAKRYRFKGTSLTTRFVDLHPEDLFGSGIINKKDSISSRYGDHPRSF